MNEAKQPNHHHQPQERSMTPYEWCIERNAKVGDHVEMMTDGYTSTAEIEDITPEGVRITDDGVTILWTGMLPGWEYRLVNQ
jgi:hypothetical protein